MRLPEFLTQISPVRETLESIALGEAALTEAVEEKNRQVCLETAESGLSLWEADYGLPDRTGGDAAVRRAAVRAAIAGGHTLTPAYLRELCVTIGGGDEGRVEEDFPRWHVTAEAVCRGGIPAGAALLERTVTRMKPAHLAVEVAASARLESAAIRRAYGGVLAELRGSDAIRSGLNRNSVLTGDTLIEAQAGSKLPQAAE